MVVSHSLSVRRGEMDERPSIRGGLARVEHRSGTEVFLQGIKPWHVIVAALLPAA
jgi:hypothetical protein